VRLPVERWGGGCLQLVIFAKIAKHLSCPKLFVSYRHACNSNSEANAMSYVDTFVMPVPEANMDAYKKSAKLSAKVWVEHGALQYVEAVADDVPEGKTTDFYRAVKRKEGETVVVGYAFYKNRKHRDEVMKKVMADKRMEDAMKNMPFDGKRMFWGGFKPIVEAEAKAPAAMAK
jgi:uncharacterized protein YbaA (DUF1428 family)